MTIYNIFCDHIQDGVGRLFIENFHIIDAILHVIDTISDSPVLIEALLLLTLALQAGRHLVD